MALGSNRNDDILWEGQPWLGLGAAKQNLTIYYCENKRKSKIINKTSFCFVVIMLINITFVTFLFLCSLYVKI